MLQSIACVVFHVKHLRHWPAGALTPAGENYSLHFPKHHKATSEAISMLPGDNTWTANKPTR